MKMTIVLGLVTFCGLLGCQTNGNTTPDPGIHTRSKFTSTKFEPNSVETRLRFTSSCPIGKKTAGISEFLGLFVPAAIDLTVNSIVGAVKKAGDDSHIKLSAYHDKEFYELNDNLNGYIGNDSTKCLIITSGKFNGDAHRANAFSTDFSTYTAAFKNIGLTEDPILYMEMEIESSKDGKLFRLRPGFLLQTKYFDNKTSKKKRDITFALDFRQPGSTEDEGTFASSLFELHNLELRTPYTKTDLNNLRSSWMKMPGVEQHKATLLTEIKTLQSEIKAVKDEICLDATSYELKGDPRMRDVILNQNLKAYAQSNCKEFPWKDEMYVSRKLLLDSKKTANAAAIKLAKKNLEIEQANAKTEAEKAGIRLLAESTRKAAWYAYFSAQGPKCDKLVKLKSKAKKLKERQQKTAVNAGNFEVFLELVETRSGSAFFKALGQILDDSKVPLKNYLKERYDPATRKAQTLVDATTEETNSQNKFDLTLKLYEAERNVELATIELASATDATTRAKASANLRKAQLEVLEYQRRLALLP